MAFPPVPPHHSPHPFSFSRFPLLQKYGEDERLEKVNGRGRGKSVFRKKSYLKKPYMGRGQNKVCENLPGMKVVWFGQIATLQ
jgi:hypothetical protein